MVENSSDKLKVLFVSYYIHDPSMPGFGPKYEMLSERWSGDVFHLGPKYADHVAKDFTFRGCEYDWSNVISRQWKYLVFCLKKAKELGPYDVIISYDPMICGIIGLLLKKVMKAKLVIEVNTDHFFHVSGASDSGDNRFVDWVKKRMLAFSFRYADAVKFINSAFADKYRKRFGMTESTPIQDTFFSYIATQAFEQGDVTEDRAILMVGHPFITKGADILIKAFNRIEGEYPDVSLKIIGHCDNLDDYKKLVKNEAKVTFLPGVPHKEIVSHFQQCLFYVLSSRSEGIPRVLIEAMACGKAVIGSRVGGVPDVIVDGKTGLLFESENDEDLADKMRQLLDDAEMREQFGMAGMERSKTVFSPKIYIQRYFDFMKKVVSS